MKRWLVFLLVFLAFVDEFIVFSSSKRATHMMGRTSCSMSQPFCRPKGLIELITLRLCAVILPVGRIRMGESSLELIYQLSLLLIGLQLSKKLLGLLTPVYTAVLLAGATDAADTVERSVGFLKALEDQIKGLEPHGDGRKDFTLGFVQLDTLLDAIFGAEVAVEVDLGGGNNREIGLDYDSCERRRCC